jgi:hypothetical protein
MKLAVTLLLFCFAASVHAQKNHEISFIDSVCKAIDKNEALKKKIFQQEDFMEQATDNGAELTLYYKSNVVYKIKEWVGLSYGVVITTYYFLSGKLIFVRQEEYQYEQNTATGEITSKLSNENRFVGRYYFKDGKLFNETSMGHNKFEDENNDAEKEFSKSARKYLKLFTKK